MKYPVVMVEWWDSTGGNGDWLPVQKLEPQETICLSVGLLVVDGERAKVIVPHWHEADEAIGLKESGCGEMVIPVGAIRRMVRLQEAPA